MHTQYCQIEYGFLDFENVRSSLIEIIQNRQNAVYDLDDIVNVVKKIETIHSLLSAENAKNTYIEVSPLSKDYIERLYIEKEKNITKITIGDLFIQKNENTLEIKIFEKNKLSRYNLWYDISSKNYYTAVLDENKHKYNELNSSKKLYDFDHFSYHNILLSRNNESFISFSKKYTEKQKNFILTIKEKDDYYSKSNQVLIHDEQHICKIVNDIEKDTKVKEFFIKNSYLKKIGYDHEKEIASVQLSAKTIKILKEIIGEKQTKQLVKELNWYPNYSIIEKMEAEIEKCSDLYKLTKDEDVFQPRAFQYIHLENKSFKTPDQLLDLNDELLSLLARLDYSKNFYDVHVIEKKINNEVLIKNITKVSFSFDEMNHLFSRLEDTVKPKQEYKNTLSFKI